MEKNKSGTENGECLGEGIHAILNRVVRKNHSKKAIFKKKAEAGRRIITQISGGKEIASAKVLRHKHIWQDQETPRSSVWLNAVRSKRLTGVGL